MPTGATRRRRPARPPLAGRLEQVVAALGLVTLTFVVYLPAMQGTMLWDDDALIFENAIIQAPDGLYRFWLTTEPTDYFPLTSTILWLQWRLFGAHAVGYHVVNVLLHALAAVVVWRVLRRLGVAGALAIATIFAVHPVGAGTVGWMSEQKNTLSMLLFASAMLLYVRFDDLGERRWYLLALAAFLAALLAKTSIIMMPVVLLGLAWYRRGRVAGRDLVRTAPFFGLALVLGLVTIYFQHHDAEIAEPAGLPARVAGTGWIVWFYLYKASVPAALSMIYPRWEIASVEPLAWLPLLALAAATAAACLARRGWGRAVLATLGYAVVMLLPVLGLVAMSYHQHSLVADHLQYVALLGPIVLVVGTATALLHRLGPRYATHAVCTAVVVVLAVMTWSRAHVFVSPRALWTDTLARNPAAWAAHGNLGLALANAGEEATAETHYREALRLRPDYPAAHNNLAMLRARQGRDAEAVDHYRQALALEPGFVEAHSNLGNLLSGQGRLVEAEGAHRAALALAPERAAVHNNLGLVLAKQRQHTAALDHYARASRLEPALPEPHHNRGKVLLAEGRGHEAAAAFREALRLGPALGPPRDGLAAAEAMIRAGGGTRHR